MSKLKKSKIRKKVWVDGELWDVVKIYEPTPFDTFILVPQKDTAHTHSDDKTNPIDMYMIDAGNDTFFWDTPEVDKLMKQRRKANGIRDKKVNEIDNRLSDIWLASFTSDF